MANPSFKAGWVLFVCTITHVFIHVYSMMHVAILPVLMHEFHLSFFESGLMVSIPLLASILFSLPYGLITDKISPRLLIALSLVMSGFSGLALAYVSNFWALLIPLTLINLSSTIYHPPALTIVSESLPKKRRSGALGLHGAGGTAGVAIGPITLGLMMAAFGWRLAYLIWAFPVLLSNVFLINLPDTRYSNSRSQNDQENLSKQTIQDAGLETSRKPLYAYIVLLIATTVHGLGAQSIGTYMTTYLVSIRGLREDTASLLQGFNSAIGIIGSLGGGYLADLSGNKRWLTIAYSVGVLSFIGMWLGPLWTLLITYFVGGYFGASTMAPSTALAAEFSPKSRRGLAFTIFMLSYSIIGAVAPIIAADIIESYNIEALFPFGIIITILSVTILWLLPKDEKREKKQKA